MAGVFMIDTLIQVVGAADARLEMSPVDYALLFVYFIFVLGIGIVVRRSVKSSLDFFLSGRSIPA